ncbi:MULTISPECIES: guanine deaminase [unclassified Aureimonas]|uniref:guanine deaminase n=1 Tax=unclassified Aureimonas TaxID=2615206 RepID=UPI0009E6F07B|nr:MULTISPECIES: guanine deaminase [unclassified Aureimonas]
MTILPAPSTVTAIRGRLISFEPVAEGGAPVFVEDGLLRLEDGRITAIGAASELLAGLPEGARVIDHRPHLVMPGFVDPHLHMPQTQVIGSYGAELMEWLARYTFPEESRYGDPEVAGEAAVFLVDELLRSGTTTAAVYCTSHPVSVDAFFAEARRRDLRMVAGKVMMDRNAPAALLDTPQSGYDQSKALIERWHGEGRLEYAITPRFAPTSTKAQLEATGALAAEFPDMHIQTHLSENLAEIAFVAELFPWARDYLDVYEAHGLVREKALFGHCIHLTARELAVLGERRATAVFCPTSNLFLGSGLFDRAAVAAAGARIGLATDIGGGTSYSMLRTGAEAYKVLALKGQTLPAFEAFHMMTAGNAEAMGLGARIGSLKPGLEADLVVLDTGATPAMRRRMGRCETLAEELFVLLTMGDDRSVVATYAAGVKRHDRQNFDGPSLPERPDAPSLAEPGFDPLGDQQ